MTVTSIPTSSVQGPPYPCPECAAEGTRKTFPKRGSLGSHRFSIHNVVGVSTGSTAYKAAHSKRTHTKRTAVAKRGPYNKKAKTNPLLDMIENPARIANELSAIIASKHAEVLRLQDEVAALQINIATLQRFLEMIKPKEESANNVIVHDYAAVAG